MNPNKYQEWILEWEAVPASPMVPVVLLVFTFMRDEKGRACDYD
jgi:hypothetical protein